MKSFAWYALIVISFSACRKNEITPPINPSNPPVMRYIDLKDAVIKPGQFKSIDLNDDGNTDFLFSTLLVGDPVLQRDRLQFYAYSRLGAYLLNDALDQTPVLNKGDEISLQQNGYKWFEISAIVLAEKITPLYGNVFWQGLWKNAGHKYLAIEIKSNGKDYLGWVEISFDTAAEKFILHNAAISIEPAIKLSAGL